MPADPLPHSGDPQEQAPLRAQLIAMMEELFQVPIPERDDLARSDLEAWDSFNHLRLVLELEQVYGITLSDADTLEMTSLNHILALLKRNGVEAAATAA